MDHRPNDLPTPADLTTIAEPRPRPEASYARRLAQVMARDPQADGRFWCSVVTTRIYCRPSCPSRRARPEHLRFHDTLEDARRTGFRPCARCRPEDPPLDERRRGLVERACRVLEAEGPRPSSQELARRLGVSAGHLHRVFRAETGGTPAAYARALKRQAID